tara:strand:- start:1241 stop:1444 length:204 start_codon:yes stop_codon:yes gene_type:complete
MTENPTQTIKYLQEYIHTMLEGNEVEKLITENTKLKVKILELESLLKVARSEKEELINQIVFSETGG